MRRLKRVTAMGANTAAIAAAQISDWMMADEDGTPSSMPRIASDRIVTGFTFTHDCSHPGIVSVGTNALLVNVSGNVTTKPKICTFSGLSTTTPTSTAIHDTASVKMS